MAKKELFNKNKNAKHRYHLTLPKLNSSPPYLIGGNELNKKMVNLVPTTHKPQIKLLNLFLFLSILLLLPLVTSKSLEFTLEQEEYYFKVGENAVINLTTKNAYDKEIAGMLTHTIKIQDNTQASQSTQINTQSTQFKILKETNHILIQLGTSNTPTTLDLTLIYNYNENSDKEIKLDNIKIHFVQDEEQKQNEQNEQSSKAKESMQEQLKEMLEKMMGEDEKKEQQQNQPPTTEQKMQQGQNNQDTQALKQQMQKEAQDKQQQRQEFANNLANQKEFQKQHQKLAEEGYKPKSDETNPETAESGDFKIDYGNKNGDQKSLSGEMKNNSLKSLEKFSENLGVQTKDMLNQTDFDKLSEQLEKEGFKQQNNTEKFQTNKTNHSKLEIEYKNDKNETATILADIKEGKIENLKIERHKPKNYEPLIIILTIIVIVILAYYIRKKIKNLPKPEPPLKPISKPKPINFQKETQKYLKLAEKRFKEKRYKDAYSLGSYAVRYYFTQKNKWNKETTNDEILEKLEEKKIPIKKIKECLDLCSLVEFAKYSPNKKDFNKIINTAKDVTK